MVAGGKGTVMLISSHATSSDEGNISLRPCDAFLNYAAAGFEADLLPIMPPNAVIKPDSSRFEALSAKRGKIPGRKRSGGWVGFHAWREYATTSDDLPVWSKWGAGIGMQGRRFPAIDIDVDQPDLADAIEQEVLAVLGSAPVRFGNGARRLLPYSAAGLAKQKLEFKTADGGKTQAIEFLADGQFYVVEGVHPKTGQPYWWKGGLSVAEVGAAGLTPVTPEQLDELFQRLEQLLGVWGCDVIAPAGRAARKSTVRCGVLQAPSMDAISRALKAIPNEVGYHEWIALGRAVKTAALPEWQVEAMELFLDWSLEWPDNTPDGVIAKWNSFNESQIGWDYLAGFATAEGDGSFNSAEEDFEAVMPPPAPGEESLGPLVSPKIERMFARYVWVEDLERVCDLETGALLTKTQFSVRNRDVGSPTSKDGCAWAVLISNPKRLQVAKGVTYRPGGPRFVHEELNGLAGRCVNRWQDPTLNLPTTATDEQVRVWLDHVEFLIPDEVERETVLNWLAWIVQNPGEKPNWALVIGSTAEGMGKGLMLAPVRTALGDVNVKEIGPDDLMSNNSDYLDGTRLLIVEEMEMTERKAMMNRLKPLIAAPPVTLRVNVKFQPQYAIPNTLAAIFFTNMPNALALSKGGRRYFVTWNDGQPKPDDYYAGLVSWFSGGGAALAARWLLSRDLAGFCPRGKAPTTEAREDMRLAALPRRNELIERGLAEREGPFAHRFFTVEEVFQHLSERLDDRSLTETGLAALLKREGCRTVKRLALGSALAGHFDLRRSERAMSTVMCRVADAPTDPTNAEIKDAYWADRRHHVA